MKALNWTEPAPSCAECPYDHVTAETPFGTIRITWKSWKEYPGYSVDVHPIADFFESYDTLEDAKKGASDAFKKALDESMGTDPEVTGVVARPPGVEDILKLVCLHTGLRVSLSQTELDQYIAFARALESKMAWATLQEMHDAERWRMVLKIVSVKNVRYLGFPAQTFSLDCMKIDPRLNVRDGASPVPDFVAAIDNLLTTPPIVFVEPSISAEDLDTELLQLAENAVSMSDARADDPEAGLKAAKAFFPCETCNNKGQTRVDGSAGWRQCPDCTEAS